ncbi:unnamed protein product [Macrosiphum euphorbiae]|uniref:MULE transposase domain-containing protein n=1 Tax=Macrosiphum euphorbiae TaxID=13131 RepID=A0AAV0XRS2_9HEMI|nr:unnamed protein product [Macrosiphum euphorbiae]
MAFNPLLDHDYLLSNNEDYIDLEIVVDEEDEDLDVIVQEEEDDSDDNADENNDIQRQRAETFIVLPGVRLNSKVFMDNIKYRYYKNGARNNKTYLICENQKNVAEFCPSTAWVRSEDVIEGKGTIMTRLPHNHLPPNVDIPMVNLRRSIGLAGTSTGNLATSIRQIYNQDVVLNPEGAYDYTHLQSRSSLNEMRRRRRPVNPKTVDQLAHILNEPNAIAYVSTLQHPSSRFFQHNFPLMVDGERLGVIFANTDAIEKYRELLQSITMAGIDGTFKTVPKNPTDLKKGCLLTFHIVFRNVSFPMVYALTTRMTQSTYESFLRSVQQILPLNYDRLTIITDYERGLMNAVRIIFPHAKLQGCWFHYCQSVIRYCKRSMHSLYDLFQTTVEAATVLRMVLALPHLPAEAQINCRICQRPTAKIGAVNISVFGSEIRTNNYVESFHATLLTQIGKHPNIWDFMQKLLIIENQYYLEIDQARRNLQIRCHLSRVDRSEVTSKIQGYINQLSANGDLLSFLRTAGHLMDVPTQDSLIENTQDQIVPVSQDSLIKESQQVIPVTDSVMNNDIKLEDNTVDLDQQSALSMKDSVLKDLYMRESSEFLTDEPSLKVGSPLLEIKSESIKSEKQIKIVNFENSIYDVENADQKEEKKSENYVADALSTLATAAFKKSAYTNGTTESVISKSVQPIVQVKYEEPVWSDVGVIKGTTCLVGNFYSTSTTDEHENTSLDNLPDYEHKLKINIQPGTIYKLHIAAINTCGRGEWSEISAFKTCVPGYPKPPADIKIIKGPDGARLTWSPPTSSGKILEYSVWIAIKNSKDVPHRSTKPTSTNLNFVCVYCNAHNAAIVSHKLLGAALIDRTNKPAIIFRIAAKNEKGYGPATQVRWSQDRNVSGSNNNLSMKRKYNDNFLTEVP